MICGVHNLDAQDIRQGNRPSLNTVTIWLNPVYHLASPLVPNPDTKDICQVNRPSLSMGVIWLNPVYLTFLASPPINLKAVWPCEYGRRST
jgi:hypothetical protein